MGAATTQEGPGLRRWLPDGTPLSDPDWASRHRIISSIAVAHVPAIVVFALLGGYGLGHAVVETLPVAVLATLGRRSRSRLARELATTLSLVTSSAVLVHLSGGFIELHFHFFVVVALVTLYQQWLPFLVAIAFVGLHHGIAGALDPQAVYNHPDAIAHPWSWAAVHAAFIAMASAVGMANWKLNELARHRAEEYFRRLYEGESALVHQLERTDRVKSELVAAVSHEFRTPLTAILGFAQTLQRSARRDPDQIEDFASRIHQQGLRLHELVENLLEFERPLDRGDESCRVAEVVARSALASAHVVRRGTRVVSEVSPDLEVRVSREALSLVLGNLISNAAKFSEPGTRVTVRGRRSGDDVVTIEVSNVGPDIPTHLQERVFDPFVQVDQSDTRTADGVGLGLYVVQRVTAAYAGAVSIVSQDGTTTFKVRLPASAVTETGPDRSHPDELLHVTAPSATGQAAPPR